MHAMSERNVTVACPAPSPVMRAGCDSATHDACLEANRDDVVDALLLLALREGRDQPDERFLGIEQAVCTFAISAGYGICRTTRT